MENQQLLGTLRGHSDDVHTLATFESEGAKCLNHHLLGTLRGHSGFVMSLAILSLKGLRASPVTVGIRQFRFRIWRIIRGYMPCKWQWGYDNQDLEFGESSAF
eukprot:6478060-Ditylum_brightwellii.AAC.1